MKKIISTISILTIIGFLVMPVFVNAQVKEECTIRTTFTLKDPNTGVAVAYGGSGGLATATGLPCMIDLINVVVNWTTAVIAAIIVLFVVWAAFGFLTSAGDEKKLSASRNHILYAAIALVILVLSRTIVPLIRTIIGY